MPAKADLIGKKFGRLTVVKETKQIGPAGSVYWVCQCECGQNKNVTTFDLNRGHAKSCGCLHRETILSNAENHKRDLLGKKYGALTAIKETKSRAASGSVKWECQCDCGNRAFVSAGSLENGDTKSCGCEKKKQTEETFKKAKEENCKEGTNLLSLTEKERINNTSGIKGVYFNKAAKKWQAFITFKRKCMYLGLYGDITDATKARKKAEDKYFNPILEKYGKNIIT